MTDSSDMAAEELLDVVRADALLGVVEPEHSLIETYAEQVTAATPYERALAQTAEALESTRSRLVTLRKQRGEINAEIKTLVEDEVLLTRMARIRRSASGA